MLNKAWKQFKVFEDITELEDNHDLAKNVPGQNGFYMLNEKFLNWKSQKKNIIQYIEFETTVDFRHIALNCKHETYQEMLVFSKDY